MQITLNINRTKASNKFGLQGVDVTDDELLTYISESNMMSKALEEYEGETPPTWQDLTIFSPQEPGCLPHAKAMRLISSLHCLLCELHPSQT